MRRHTRRSSALAIGLSVVSGLGHIYLGRPTAGVVYFALFAAAANGLIVAALWIGPEARTIAQVSGAALALVWLAALASAVRLSAMTDREALCLERSERLREGIVAGLRGDHRAALAAFETAARCDIDGDDADVQFHLGLAALRLGDERRAERAWRFCVHGCLEGRFRFEIERERAKLRAASGGEPAA
jgi:hypothetical protein